MRIDLWLPTASPFTTPEVLAVIGAESEERGIGTIWVGEHVVFFHEYESSYPYADDGKMPAAADSGLLEPINTLSFLAAQTSTVRLGTAVLLLPQRNPVYTAKEVSTLDWLSEGRVDLGIGVGWLEEEFAAVNVPWPARGRRTDEYLEVLTTLWCDETSAYEGEFYSLDPCSMFPKPVQQPHPPIHMGGESRAALARVARAGQGWHTFNRAPDQLAEPLATLGGLLAEQGRTRADVTVTVCPYFQPLDADRAARYAEAGADAVSALILPLGVDAVRTALDDLQPVLDRAARS
ncbi:MAG: TIGR03619 family F420-dependent LLM class oxidoreductase [Acidimicrobiales bacterium]